MNTTESLKQKAYFTIKEKIVNCEMKPGEVIDEKSIMESIGCGRTPVHEAINLLTGEGLIRIIPRRGMLVTDISIKDICDLYEFKKDIEPLIIRQYGTSIKKEDLLNFKKMFENAKDISENLKHDRDFHAMLMSYCTNKYYSLLMNQILDQSQRVRVLTNNQPHNIKEGKKEHIDIINYLLNGDTENAAKRMEEHYINSLKDILEIGSVSNYIIR